MEIEIDLANKNQPLPQSSQIPNQPIVESQNTKLVKVILYVVSAIAFIAIGAFGYGYFQNKKETAINPDINLPTQTQPTQQVQPVLTIEPTISKDISLDNARFALLTYFTLLHDKNYTEAITYHGSGYEYLQGWNPNVNKNDYVKLLENGCTENGLHCLKVSSILEEKIVSPTEYTFKIQFSNEDGTIFKRGPCCGATEKEMPTQTNFDYTVRKIDLNFKVTTQPVYTP